MLKSLKRKAWSQLVDICDNRKGETLRKWIPHTGLNGVKQAYTDYDMVLYFKEKCTCFGPLSSSMSICLRLARPRC